MKYILVSLPALVSVASAAEIVGTYYMPAMPAPASVVEVSSQATPEAAVAASGEYTVSAATSTAPMEPTQTPVPASSWAATEEVPYWHMTQYGYKDMGCGYGYRKDDQGYCKPESWVCTVSISHFSLVVDPCLSDCSMTMEKNAMRPLSSTSE